MYMIINHKRMKLRDYKELIKIYQVSTEASFIIISVRSQVIIYSQSNLKTVSKISSNYEIV